MTRKFCQLRFLPCTFLVLDYFLCVAIFLTQISHHWVFCPALQRHYTNMRCFITSEIGITARHSRFILPGKKIERDKTCDFEGRAWDSFCESHPNIRVLQSCLENMSPFRFWSLANQFPDLVSRMHVQMRLMGNFILLLTEWEVSAGIYCPQTFPY